MKDYTLFVILFLICALVGPPMIGSSYRAEEAESDVNKQGFSEVECTNNHYLLPGIYGCSGSLAAWECTATNANGDSVDVVACMGWFRGTSVRIP
jgi:hypothetical protein